jgi:hypothetical protein
MDKRLRLIEDYVREHGITIRFVDTGQLYGYDGMNSEAAREFGYPGIPENTILVDKRLGRRSKHRTIQHEIEEMLLMRQRGLRYWPAHQIAFKREMERLEKIQF